MISNTEQNSGGRGSAKSAEEEDFKKIVDLLAVHSTAENDLEQLQATANQEFLLTVDGLKGRYAKLQQKMTEAETQLELLARKHPEWFQDKKTIKTPYGSVQLKNNPPKIVADNPELSIVLIERDGESDPEVQPEKLIHQEKSLNLEALAGCTDAQLKRWRLRREQTDTFTVKSAKLDMGKAVKEATSAEGKQEKK
jgi:hypothetical protein